MQVTQDVRVALPIGCGVLALFCLGATLYGMPAQANTFEGLAWLFAAGMLGGAPIAAAGTVTGWLWKQKPGAILSTVALVVWVAWWVMFLRNFAPAP
jgi:hypothetical protein